MSHSPECCSRIDSVHSSPTRSRNFYKIDMHTHIMPPSLPASIPWLTLLPAAKNDNNLDSTPQDYDIHIHGKFFRRVQKNTFDVSARLADMDAHNIAVQVLSTIPILFFYDREASVVAELCRFLNEHIAKLCRTHPTRFVGLGTVPLQDPEEAVKELRRCKEVLGLKGLEIGTTVGERNIYAARFDGFWRACEELDMPVFVHPLGYSPAEENPERWDPYWSSWLVGMPSETGLAIHGITAFGLLLRYPKLRICFAHSGGCFPTLLGRIQHGFDCRPDLVARDADGHTPSEQLCSFSNIWIDSLTHDPDLLEYLRKKIGSERVLMGSDYPFPPGEVPEAGKMLATDKRLNAVVSWHQRAQMLAGNAIEFLKLDDAFRRTFEERTRRALS